MNQSDMSKVMDKILKEVAIMRDAGQEEYSHDNSDVFANFNRVSDLLDVDRKKVLMTYMLKHIDGIAAYVKGHKSQREDVTGRITDCMVYLMLLWGMIEEEKGYGTLFGTKDNSPLYNVLESISSESECLSVDGGRKLPNRILSESDLQKVRKTRDGFKKSETVGTT